MAGLRRVLLGLWLEIRVIPVLLWSFTAITLGTALAWRDGDGIADGQHRRPGAGQALDRQAWGQAAPG